MLRCEEVGKGWSEAELFNLNPIGVRISLSSRKSDDSLREPTRGRQGQQSSTRSPPRLSTTTRPIILVLATEISP